MGGFSSTTCWSRQTRGGCGRRQAERCVREHSRWTAWWMHREMGIVSQREGSTAAQGGWTARSAGILRGTDSRESRAGGVAAAAGRHGDDGPGVHLRNRRAQWCSAGNAGGTELHLRDTPEAVRAYRRVYGGPGDSHRRRGRTGAGTRATAAVPRDCWRAPAIR